MKMNAMQSRPFLLTALVLLAVGGFFACPARAMNLTITAGEQGVPGGPVYLDTTGLGLALEQDYYLDDGGPGIATQSDEQGRLWWWQSPMKPGEKRTYTLRQEDTGSFPVPGSLPIRVRKTGDGVITVNVDRKPFTTLNFKKEDSKVYLYPVLAPGGEAVTRAFPMEDLAIEKDNQRQDHPHHRSLWCAHGDVRSPNFEGKANYWHVADKPEEQDRQVCKRIVRMCGGRVFGQIEAEIDWVTHTGVRQLTELRTYTFFASKDNRVIDVKSVFKFDETDVTFADTKEGGVVALRVAVTIDEKGVEKPKPLRGQMCNSAGQKGAKECWGQPAEWCDYVGPVLAEDPEKVNTVGIAVFDHPKNYGHPVRWHIRDYGLYTANPFGLGSFTNDKTKDGSHTFKKGQTAEFNYRVFVHQGDTQAAHVPAQWKLYSDPPKMVTDKQANP